MSPSAARQPQFPERHPADSDPLLSFDAEADVPTKAPGLPHVIPVNRSERRAFPWAPMVLVALCLSAGVASYVGFSGERPTQPVAVAPASVVTTGTAVISSQPEGAHVIINGEARGVTPLRLTLPKGDYTVELQNSGATRSIPIAVEAGATVSHYIELTVPASVGRIEISSDPAGARVTLDGISRGTTPLVLPGVARGQHTVVISGESSSVTRTVAVTPGATSVVMATLSSGVAAGWMSVVSPIELQVYEDGKLVGLASADRIMLPVGRHQLDLVNTVLEFRTSATVQVQTGKTVTTTVEIPNGSLSINAVPWADVLVDGRPVGTTPLANLSIPIGQHEVIWRHPRLGERRQTVMVPRQTPARVGMDLNR
jgi:PEGA domain-containing protein